MNGIIRVFPTQTDQTPLDNYTFFDGPDHLWIPSHKEIHVSCTFTWDKPKAEQLTESWKGKAPVKLGGPAYEDPGGNFVPGMYSRRGITYTSRGCPNNCSFCFVPKREGKIRELTITEGNEIQDNNFLACRKDHRRKVYDMLRTQKAIRFVGGLEAGRLTDWDIEEMQKLRIKELWLACDSKGAIRISTRVIRKLSQAGFKRDKIRCYALIGDDMEENESRLRAIFEAGAKPFAQLYQPEQPIEYSKEWKQFARTWSRPAATAAHMKKVHNAATN